MEKMHSFVPRVVLFTLLLLLAATAASAAGTSSCSCTISCDNGTSCSASGAGCSCTCSWWSGNANCSGTGAAAASLSSDELASLLTDGADGFIKDLTGALGGNAANLCESVQAASDALAAQDDEAYSAALAKMDASFDELSSADAAVVQEVSKAGSH